MFSDIHIEQPTIHDKNGFEVAIMLEKMVMILGLINIGTPADKAKGKEELVKIEKELMQCLNREAFRVAAINIGYTKEELKEVFSK
ncbi:hypothetical protein [Bacillus pinisoli]|uniref:hypothetical protein n=1 Tax=Bacillus pinisoli TaxID=2901866 RepID=UPI001FF43A7F|nr:hypothetical protein [Bacillus pinisoli]